MLWIGMIIIAWVVGRYLPTWVAVAFPLLIIGLGVVASASARATDSQRGLAVYVAVLVAAITGVAAAVGRLARRRRASRS
jgi:hypothetical protein